MPDLKDVCMYLADGTEENGEQMVDGLEAMGFWGFANPKTNVIHFWTNGKVSDEQLIWFFGHEIGHLSGKPYANTRRNYPKEEDRADLYGQVASEALKLLREVRQTHS